MIYTDGVHLICDGDIEELHRFAAKIGLRRSWFQGADKASYLHYDMTVKWRVQRALNCGAKLISPKECLEILQQNKMAKRFHLNKETGK